ncbi:hypothetical protein BX666DRAFT_1860928 [Dichotomocladium elegans]|nr:hypothetical protein BX666DRAFT_1860928 [Dichotomocladium elegans]
MDLGSLLNQGTEGLSLHDLRLLLDESECTVKLNRITNPSFTFPSSLHDTYAFFDVFIQVLLTIDYTDDQFGSQYTKTIVVEALRSCVNGLLQENGFSWLLCFSRHLSLDTWRKLEDSQSDTTILVYLYGLVLPLLMTNQDKENISINEWAESLVQFVKAKSSALTCHIWMSLWFADDNWTHHSNDDATTRFYKIIEEQELAAHKGMDECLSGFITILKTQKMDIISSIDKQLGRVLRRPPFTEDQFILAFAKMEMMSPRLYSAKERNNPLHSLRLIAANPLVCSTLLKRMPSDPADKMKNLQKATRLWIERVRTLSDTEFALYLQDLIKSHYPTDRKIMLDRLIAYWTIRDPFEKHSSVILDAIIAILQSSKYNLRSSPYYGFMEYFQGWSNGSGNEEGGYNVMTGALIDISRFSGYKNAKLHRGCCRMLEYLTPFIDRGAGDWLSDCLDVATPDIIEWYAGWLCEELNAEMKLYKRIPSPHPPPHKKKKSSNQSGSDEQPKFAKYIHTMVQSSRVANLRLDVVPTMLRTLTDRSLEFLLGYSRNLAELIIQYFGGFPQLSTEVLVTDLVKTKSKKYLDLLLGCLRENMSETRQASNKSRAWFSEHFVGSILSAAGDDTDANSVASQLFRQILKTRGDFDFYLGTPLLPEDEESRPPAAFQRLDISKNHTILWVQHIGLISLLHEMVRLRDRRRIEHLVSTWRSLWLIPNQGFAVPLSWILQCIGLYDKAPALVKQMIHDFMMNGIRQDMRRHENDHVPDLIQAPPSASDRFVVRVIDLIMLGDISEADTIFDLFLWQYEAEITAAAASSEIHNRHNLDDEIIFEIVSILLRLGEELKIADLEAPIAIKPPQSKRDRQQPKKHKQPQKLKNQQQLRNMQLGGKWVHRKKQKRRYSHPRDILMVLVQRALHFLSLLVGEEPGESAVKQTIRAKLLEQPLLYEALRTLREAIRNSNDDLASLIDLSCETLQAQQKTALLVQAQTILAQ